MKSNGNSTVAPPARVTGGGFKCLREMLQTTHTQTHTVTRTTPSVFEADTVCYCPDCIVENRLETDAHQVTVAGVAKVHDLHYYS